MSKVKCRTYRRSDLVARLMDECDLSRGQSVAVVNAILERMIYRLRRGHAVEFPYGVLKRVKRYFGKQWGLDDDWPANRDPYTIEYQPAKPGAQQALRREN